MNYLAPLLVGWLFAAGIYLLTRRNLLRHLLGIALLTHATNLLVFTAGGLTRGQAPIMPGVGKLPPEPYADPLPQALLLTAIVIGFGITAFAVTLVYRLWKLAGTADADALTAGQ